jgi:hypothetical protein
MVASTTLKQANGNEIRGGSIVYDFDNTASFNTGTIIGATVQTQKAGVDVDAAAALDYTSTGAETGDQLIRNLADTLQAALTGADVSWSENEYDNQYSVSIEAIHGVADHVILSLPVLTPGP